METVCNKGNIFAGGVYVDFKKAFDTVNHEFLFNKLNNYGIRETEFQWFKMYLRGQQQHTTLSSLSSKNAYIRYQLWSPSRICPGSFPVPYLHK